MTDPYADGSAIDRWFHSDVIQPMDDFNNPRQEWRRLISEAFGTFLLVLVAAGGGMVGQAFPRTVRPQAAVGGERGP